MNRKHEETRDMIPTSSWGFPRDFHDHVVLVAVSRSREFPQDFRVVSASRHPASIIQLIESTARDILSNAGNWYEAVIKRRPHHDFDSTHSLTLSLEHATKLNDTHMLCFSFHICADTQTCADGLFVRSQ
jgi:hypothetical protein